jgi:hypothetical protein
MKQVLLIGTRKYSGQCIVVWAALDLMQGDVIRWNGAPWRVDSIYGTRLTNGHEARIRDKPSDLEYTSH